MKIGAALDYFTRLAISSVAGVYVVAYGFPMVIVVAVVALGLDRTHPLLHRSMKTVIRG